MLVQLERMHEWEETDQMDRRQFVATATAATLAQGLAVPAGASQNHKINDDGLHVQDWFINSFMDLREDFTDARNKGKRFAVFFEQKGCPYCAEMHKVNLARPEINKYIRENFAVLQVNLWGARECTDFDGKTMEERELAKRWRVLFTPTIVFFPASLEGLDGKSGRDIEIARMPGYFKPFHFITFFEYIRSEGYKTVQFQRYLQDKFKRLEAKGMKPTVW